MYKFFISNLLLFQLLSYSQNLPDFYYFSDDNKQLLRGGLSVVDGLYSESDIDTFFLYFDQPEYWTELQDNYCDKINIAATMIYKNEIFNQVGVRFKGQTSYANTNGDTGGGARNLYLLDYTVIFGP